MSGKCHTDKCTGLNQDDAQETKSPQWGARSQRAEPSWRPAVEPSWRPAVARRESRPPAEAESGRAGGGGAGRTFQAREQRCRLHAAREDGRMEELQLGFRGGGRRTGDAAGQDPRAGLLPPQGAGLLPQSSESRELTRAVNRKRPPFTPCGWHEGPVRRLLGKVFNQHKARQDSSHGYSDWQRSAR